VHSRQRPSCDFSTRAKSARSVAAPTGAVADREPDASRLTLRVDNGRQCTGRSSGDRPRLGIKLEYT